MNILFFITPKSETAYLYDDCSLRQAIEKIEYHKYTAVPVLNKNCLLYTSPSPRD